MSFTTIPAAGAKLRASVLSALVTEARPIAAVVSSDQGLTTSSTTLQNVTALTVALPINQIFDIELTVFANLASGTTEDIKIGFTFPTGAALTAGGIGGTAAGVSGGSSTDVALTASAFTSGVTTLAFGLSTTGTTILIKGRLTMGSTAGSLQVQAAQNTSGGNLVTVVAGSLLIATQVL